MTYRQTPIDRRIARDTKRNRQAAKRDQRREARRDRPHGEGAPVAWELSTTVPPDQYPSAYDTSNPIVAGVGRALSRGLQ